jgi:Flp pilus assembly protein TadG
MTQLSPRSDRRVLALRRAVQRFGRAQGGVAALEFALIAPALVAIFFGVTEVTVKFNTDRKLALVTRTLADLTGRATTMSTDDIGAVFAAGATIMQPYSTADAGFKISSIVVTTSGSTVTGKVAWSCVNGVGMTKDTVGSNYTVPAGFTTSSSFIVVATKTVYTPILTGGSTTLNETLPWPVRNGAQVTWQGNPCT